MSGYWGVFKLKLISNLQYRAAAWAGICTQFFWGAMRLMILYAFYESGAASARPMEMSQLSAYIWLQQAFLAMIMLWWQDTELLESISSGMVSYELVRPYQIYPFWFMRLIATRISRTLLRFPIILIVAFLLPQPWKMTLPPNPAAFTLFLVSMMLSMLLVTAISMFIYITTFITLSPNGVRMLLGVAAEFLAGSVIPIPMMPERVQSVLWCLPFAYTADIPFRIYSGSIGTTQAGWMILGQVCWIVALIITGIWCLSRITSRISIQGG